ncbi:MAG: DUF262 domain-containing HNH endonuclease family protein [Parvibaculum sp.]|uniref:DUF262 domain-containing protein n=1 Tax=Parvibaculum sp. TaxID=2024848 RepID=UPI002601443A|nr:DUF262 domain-containing HNH endonuclease family protein [Parvibaculum sp.]MCE9649629.1 DUF262 domain-containing HNH endonuclease family protein [Parvibaculum sp.]
MKAGPIEIGRLLQQRQRFCVPIYQRHYVWTRAKQWEPLWNDIRTKAIECLAGRERRFSHFMGAVVLEARGGFSARRVPAFQVIDGQQRLTTFQIFLAAARDYARVMRFDTTAEQISGYLINDKANLMEDREVEIYKVWPTQYDRQIFIDIISTDRKELRKKYAQFFYARQDKIYDYSTVPPLLGGYGYFYDRIKHSVETDDLDDEFTEAPEVEATEEEAKKAADKEREIKLDTIWKALVEEFKIVEITLEEGDDAQVIFETLNERGEPLLAADLVRNNIFYRADAANEHAEKLFATHWKPFEYPFWNVEEKQGRYKKPRIEFFLANFIAGQIGGEVNLTKLFSEYKAFTKSRHYVTVSAELKELERYGAIYRELIERTADTPLVRFSRKLQPWDVTTVYPLVLRIWSDENMEEADKVECLNMLLSFIVRRAICGLTNKNYNKFFLSVIVHMKETGWKSQTLADFLLSQKAETGRFPRDDEFEQRWMSSPSYTVLQPARTRAVLEEIERSKRTKFHETSELAPHLTVEHVLPREWQEHWPLPDGTIPTAAQLSNAWFAPEDDSVTGAIVKRQRVKETFGNLTLLTQPLNSSVRHGPFSAKRIALQDHSLLVLSREVTQNDHWDEDVISKRGKALFAIARDLWKLP